MSGRAAPRPSGGAIRPSGGAIRPSGSAIRPSGGAIRLRGWGWRHRGRTEWAVRGVDLEIEPGERVLLLGPSGAGKSTVLLGIAGLLDPHGGDVEGELTVDGVDPREARDRTGLVLQDPESQIVMARAGDDVAFGLENAEVPPDEIWPRVDQALAAVGFPYGRHHATDRLSGGEQQRLVLAGVLARESTVVLLDEPTASLDPAGGALVRQAVRQSLGSARTLVLVEHRVAEALELVDRVVVIEPGGGVVADGESERVFAVRGADLAARGVWVPGHPLPVRTDHASTGEVLLQGEGLRFAYPAAPRPAVRGADLVLRAGEAVAILGSNGSGKSTLALMIAGLLTPTAGKVVGTPALGGPAEPLHDWPARELAQRVGTVFQDPEHQFLARTVFDELAIGPRVAGLDPEGVRARVDALLHRLHLDHLAQANPFTLSGGEKRRLSVATALAASPRVLVLDEPTFGQDRRTWLELLDLLDALRAEGTTVTFVSHDETFVRALADRVLIMQDGELAPTSGPEDTEPASFAEPQVGKLAPVAADDQVAP